MSEVEVYTEGEVEQKLFTGSFAFLPRIGEYISKDSGGYFDYLRVIEVWHREDLETGSFRACVAVRLED